jgi:hypothetical protein
MISDAKYAKFMGKPRAVQDPAQAEAGRIQQLARNAASHKVVQDREDLINAQIRQARNQIMADTKASGLKGQALADARAQALSAARTANRAQMPAPAPTPQMAAPAPTPQVGPPPRPQENTSTPPMPTPEVSPVRQPDDTGFVERTTPMKKGGFVKYTDKNGRINLGSGRVSTHTPNKKSPNW